MDEQQLHEAMDKLLPDYGPTLESIERGKFDPETAMYVDNLEKIAHSELFQQVREALREGVKPASDFYNDKTIIDRIVDLEKNLAKTFDAEIASNVEIKLNNASAFVKAGSISDAFDQLKDIKRFMSVMNLFPDAQTSKFKRLRDKFSDSFDPIYSRIIPSRVHEQNLGRIRFTKNYVNLALATDVAFEDPVTFDSTLYAHIFAERPLNQIAQMTGQISLKLNGETISYKLRKEDIGESAYLVIPLIPEEGHAGKSRKLIENSAEVLASLAGGETEEFELELEADFVVHYSDTVTLDLSTIDADAIQKNAQKTSEIAEKNLKESIQLPDEFSKPYQGFKDLDRDTLKEILERTWLNNNKIEIIAMRPHKYQNTKIDWLHERTVTQLPYQRRTNGFWSVVYRANGKVYLAREVAQFSQYYDWKTHEYGPKICVSYFHANSDEITEDHLKKIKE